MYSICIQYVFNMYSICIQYVFNMYSICIQYVFNMYSICIQYVFNMLQQHQNSYPMKDWHLEHMQKTIVKYVTGLSDTATSYQRRQHKKYGGKLAYTHKSIAFDIRHGVTTVEVLNFLDKVRNDR